MSFDAMKTVRVRCAASWPTIAAAFAAAVCTLSPGPATAEVPSLAKVERAVLAADAGTGSLQENWAPVVRLLADVNEQTPDPVLRLIKGHACLAVNQNNESVCLFLSVRSKDALGIWDGWVDHLAANHPQQPLSHYFCGDAAARRHNWDEAIAHFAKAIEINPVHLLALNARGVCQAFRQQWDQADQDLYFAAMIDKAFVDARANIAMKLLHKQEGASGALQHFSAAMTLSSPTECRVAFFGRAWTKCLLGDIQGAKVDMQTATNGQSTECNFLRQQALRFITRMQTSGTALAKGPDASMSIQRSKERITNDMNRMIEHGNTGFNYRFLNEPLSAIKSNSPELQQHARAEMNRALQENPGLNDDFRNGITRHETHLQSVQGLVAGLKFEPKVSIDGGAAAILPGAVVAGKVGGAVAVDLFSGKGLAETMNHDIHAISSLRNDLNFNSPADGFKTGVEGAAWDRGDWPCEPIYGLLYEAVRPAGEMNEGQES